MKCFQGLLVLMAVVLICGCSSQPAGKPKDRKGNSSEATENGPGKENPIEVVQEKPEEKPVVAESEPGEHPEFVSAVLPFLTNDHFAAAGVDLTGALESPLVKETPRKLFEMFVHDAVRAFGMYELRDALLGEMGFKYGWALYSPRQEDSPAPLGMSFLLAYESSDHLEAVFTLKELIQDGNIQEKTHQGHKYYVSNRGAGLFYVNETTAFMALEEASLKQALERTEKVVDTELARRLKSVKSTSHLVAAGSIEPARELLLEMFAEGVEGPLSPLAKLPKQLSAGTLVVDLEGPALFDARLEAVDEQAAADLTSLVNQWVSAGKELIKELKAAPLEEAPDAKTIAYMLEIGGEGLQNIKLAAEGKSLHLEAARPLTLSKWPQLAKEMDVVREKLEQRNNAKQVGLAVHNYRSSMAKWPADVTNEQGEKLLSWRATILPFLEQQNIYDRLDFEHAWDSDVNKEMSAVAIPTYLTPHASGNKTTLKWVSGNPADIMIIDAGPGKEIEWAKPEEFKLDPADPLASLGEEPEGGYVVVMMNGAVLRIPGKELVEMLQKKPE